MNAGTPVLDTPLEGRQLIEANAGTGKTWTIENLYLRFLLEKRLEVRQILVVTFTDAATAELRERIRGNIAAFKRHLEQAEPPAPGKLASLFDTLAARLEGKGEKALALRLLQSALLRFDEAAISTIHGFCHRALRELAFESGTLFDAAVTSDPRDFGWESVDDFLRKTYLGAHPLFVRQALALKKKGLDPEELEGIGRKVVADPGLEVVPAVEELDPRETGAALERAFREAAASWQESSKEVRALLLGSCDRLHRYGEKTMGGYLAALDAFLSGGDPLAGASPGKKLGASVLRACTKAGDPPAHPLLDRLDELDRLRAALEAGIAQARVRYAGFARRQAEAAFLQGGALHFDDLLTRLKKALEGEGRQALAARLSSRFRAALIDEFQDTDPVQFGIFDALFEGSDAAIFLVGDPKQAIYRFRGADVFAYIGAKSGIPGERRHNLTANHRSVPGLVEAVNALFDQPGAFLQGDDIPYHRSQAGRDDLALVEGEEENPAPFRVWHLPNRNPVDEEGKRKPLGKGGARRDLFETTASEIASLVAKGKAGTVRLRFRDGKGELKERTLGPGDLAVLVKTNSQARQVQRTLRGKRIPAVIHSAKSLFSSPEAPQLLRVLQAMEEPGNDGRLRAALATDMLGVTADRLREWMDGDGRPLEEARQRFRAYARAAREGFTRMADALLEGEKVRERLLALPDGERRLTNLLHLLELLHRAHPSHRGGVETAIAWLTPLLARKPEDDVSQLRLESDAEAVTISTIHRSKGLQWPVVFCPAAWGDWQVRDNFPILHRGNAPYLDLGSPDRELAKVEARAESRRTLYVALTRARYRCTVGWGAINATKGSALADLLHGEGADPAAMSDEAIAADLAALTGRSQGAVRVEPPPRAEASPPSSPEGKRAALGLREIAPARLRPAWSQSSFSRLESRTVHGEGEGSRRDDDEAPAPAAPEEQAPAPGPRDFSRMPGGREVGDALHRILERLDFAAPRGDASLRLIGSALGKADWSAAVAERLERVLSTPLGDTGIVLRDVPAPDRVAEMRFFLGRGRGERWSWEGVAGGKGRELDLETRHGVLTGSIDLVFRHQGRYWLLDWKTNNLGPEGEGYDAGPLGEEMERRLYTLQAGIYAVALHRHLRARLGDGYDPAHHFGGALYIFLRGVDASVPGRGVWCWRPDAAALARLDSSLGRGPA